jgi:hypothetical protein
MSPVDENDKARHLPERAAKARHQSELGDGHRRGDWLDFLPEACEPTPGQIGYLQTQVAGHRWHVGRCLSGAEDFSAACSCGWGCTQTGSVAAMLRQVKEHLAAVREIRGGRPSPRVPTCGERKRKANQRAIRPHQRARDLRAAVAGQQMRLCQSGAALPGMAAEAAWTDQDVETRRPGGAECQPVVGVASETAGTARQQ